MAQLPKPFRDFSRAHADVVSAYEALGRACAEAGPLDAKTRELIKLGMAIGGRLEGAVHAHARRALAAGATPAEVQHVVTLAIPTVGFPTTIAAFTWVGDVLSGRTKGPTAGTRSGSSR
jgi:AhpD family alkylhydroperoxidase